MTVAVRAGTHTIQPVALQQVVEGFDGRMILVDDDVANVARDLRAIDPALELRYSERHGHFVVVQIIDQDGRRGEHLVTTAEECDQRIVERVRQIADERYDLAAELARVQAQGERDSKANGPLAEAVDENVDRLLHAIRRDLRVQNRIYVP